MIKIILVGDEHILGDKLANINHWPGTNYCTSKSFLVDFFHFFGLICEE